MLSQLYVILIASETVGDWEVRNKSGFALNLDYEKAYDKVDWLYLDVMMEQKGFGPQWRRWIKGCLSTVNFSIVINSRPWGKILAKRGLRQGNTLSPFLFTLIGDSFSRMIHYCSQRRLIKGFGVGRQKVEVSHLQYADDTIIFCPNEPGMIDRWWMFLDIFLKASGLTLNLRRTLIWLHVEEVLLQTMANKWDAR